MAAALTEEDYEWYYADNDRKRRALDKLLKPYDYELPTTHAVAWAGGVPFVYEQHR